MTSEPKKKKTATSSQPTRIVVFDTTLRDGEQSPGASLNVREKLEIAYQLARMNVDVIEAGFPIASPGDFEAVQLVSREVKGVTVAGLARAVEKDILRAAEALKDADKRRIHVFLATSEIHRMHKLRMDKEAIVAKAAEGVALARQFTDDVEFSPEDASRTERDFLAKVVTAVIDAGATTVNIPDTVGYAVPDQYADLIRYLMETVPNIDQAIISVHCHNDLGLAVANSLAAIRAGARQVECTVNGLGERAGNAAMEEIVMALKVRNDFYNAYTEIDTQRIYPVSRLVSKMTGLHVQRNKAIVGENAFAHEAGIHQDGVLKEPTTYEIMRPEDVGQPCNRIVLGKHSGRHAFYERARELGFKLTEDQLNAAFQRFKILADKKKEIFDDDIIALIEDELAETPQIFKLERLETVSGTDALPMAAVELRKADNKVVRDAAIGDGPVDAIYRTIDRITGISCRLNDYQIRAVTEGKDAMGEVFVAVESEGEIARARAASTDIIEASAIAYLNAVNRIAYRRALGRRRQNGAPSDEGKNA